MKALRIALLSTAWIATAHFAQEAVPQAPSLQERARAAVAKSLPLIQSSGETWFEERTCTSCHHGALNLMTVEYARELGIAVDTTARAALIDRYGGAGAEANERTIQGLSTINPQIGQSYRWVSLRAAGVGRSRATDAAAHLLASLQHTDGSWPSQSVRPPLEASAFTATAWSLRALRELAPAARAPELEARARRARDWLAASEPRDAEDRAMKLFGLAWGGAPTEQREAAANAILGAQRKDGGWAQHATRASDAYATGQALVALHHVGGLATASDAYRRGVEHLLATQHGDGSWLVTTRRIGPGLPYFETGFPHGEHQFLSCAATCWATSALLGVLREEPSPVWRGAAGSSAAPQEVLTDLPPLLDAALTGDVAALRARLDAGDDVNTRSAHGLTALLIAAGDPAKAELLLARGADPTVATSHGTSALAAAAGCAGAVDSLRALLARKTDVWPSPDELGRALRRAAIAGDAANAALLLDAGAPIDAAGTQGETALMLAAYQGDAALVRFLIARGASTSANDAGTLALLAAAMDDRFEVAHALLVAGVQIDAPDPDAKGRTPLGWAVELDFGDTRMVELLLARGANPHARTADGVSVLDFAKRGANRAAERLLRGGTTTR